MERFRNRTDAGAQLAARLSVYTDCSDAVVLGLPKGGVPVAYEVATALHLPLDVCLVRKLGAPGHPELAVGAIAENGLTVLSRDLIDKLHISEQALDQIIEKEKQVLNQQQQAYRENHPLVSRQDCRVIVVDDGIATGATMLAAIKVLRFSTEEVSTQPKAIVAAIPVAPLSVCQHLQRKVNQLVCLSTPYPFQSVSLWYKDFAQTTEKEVKDLLSKSSLKQRSLAG